MSNRPVVLLGLDGLGREFLDSPLVTQAAPNLVALLRDGGVTALPSTFPPYTAPAWTSITTGVGPGRHGVFGFTDAHGHPVSDASVAAPRLWDYVGGAGGRSLVVNMPITHPARAISGTLVSGMPVPPGLAYTEPRSLAGELEADGYITDVAVREDGNEGVDTVDRLRAMTEARGRALVRLAQRETWDLLVAVFVLPDRLGHPWWKWLVPGDALYDGRNAASIRDAAGAALRALDTAVADLLAALPTGAAVVCCSDHGFGSLRADLFTDVAFADAGLVDAPIGAGVLGRVGRSAIGRRLPSALRRMARVAIEANDDSRVAFTATPYECGVRVRDPAVADDVIAVLKDLCDPDGVPLVAAVHRREELYDGPHVDRAPDLLVELADESVDLHDGFHAPSPWVTRHDVPWGTHRADGVVAVHGAAMTSRGSAPDVAATVLDLLGLDVAGLDGRSLVSADGAHETVTAPAAAAAPAGSVYTDEEEAAVFEHLRGLGYVD
jgi:predicted AlkP superfamily phosphohydrolase/phosphomutase